MEKYKECEDCVYGADEVFKKSDCDKCEAGSNYLSFQTFNKEIEPKINEKLDALRIREVKNERQV